SDVHHPLVQQPFNQFASLQTILNNHYFHRRFGPLEYLQKRKTNVGTITMDGCTHFRLSRCD
ncbi:MAG: hypothetical protein ACE5G1_10580, partial [bacterium]